VYHYQAVVYISHQYQHSGHDLHLWWDSKCYWKSILRTRGGVLRSQEVSLGLGKGPGEEHGIVREDWGCNEIEIRLGRREQEKEEQRQRGGV